MTNYNKYIDDGARVLRGLTALGVTLNLTHVTKAIYEPVFLDFKARHLAFEQGRQGKADAYEALRQKRRDADAFLRNVRGYLKGFLGESWSALWSPLGFINPSLKLPETDVHRCEVLEKIKVYFTNNPQFENAAKEYTAAKSEAICMAMTDARNNTENSRFDSRAKRDARDAAKALLDEKISAVRNELGLALSSTDSRWLKFFDRIPGDPRVPEKVETVIATAQPGGIIHVDWPDTARAARYRVLKQVVGTDPDFLVADTVDESEAQVNGVPAGATIKLQIVPFNGVGPGAASDVIQLQAA